MSNSFENPKKEVVDTADDIVKPNKLLEQQRKDEESDTLAGITATAERAIAEASLEHLTPAQKGELADMIKKLAAEYPSSFIFEHGIAPKETKIIVKMIVDLVYSFDASPKLKSIFGIANNFTGLLNLIDKIVHKTAQAIEGGIAKGAPIKLAYGLAQVAASLTPKQILIINKVFADVRRQEHNVTEPLDYSQSNDAIKIATVRDKTLDYLVESSVLIASIGLESIRQTNDEIKAINERLESRSPLLIGDTLYVDQEGNILSIEKKDGSTTFIAGESGIRDERRYYRVVGFSDKDDIPRFFLAPVDTIDSINPDTFERKSVEVESQSLLELHLDVLPNDQKLVFVPGKHYKPETIQIVTPPTENQ